MYDERVWVFIDGSNFYHCLKNQFSRTSVNFEKLVSLLVGTRKLIRAYYYNVQLPHEYDPGSAQKQQRFMNQLRNTPYFDVYLGHLEPRNGNFVEKGIDVQIATDMLRRAYVNAYDTAILVSGDSDLVPAVEGVKEIGKHVENAFVSMGESMNLRQTCDRFILLDANFMSQCWI